MASKTEIRDQVFQADDCVTYCEVSERLPGCIDIVVTFRPGVPSDEANTRVEHIYKIINRIVPVGVQVYVLWKHCWDRRVDRWGDIHRIPTAFPYASSTTKREHEPSIRCWCEPKVKYGERKNQRFVEHK